MQPEAGSSLGRRRRLLRSAVALLAFSVVACATAGVGPGETATDDGLSLSARSDHASVEPGGKVTIETTIHNGRSSPVVYSVTCDSTTIMAAALPLPLDPPGRSWTALEADLKEAALGRSTVATDTPDEMETRTYSGSCSSGFQG